MRESWDHEREKKKKKRAGGKKSHIRAERREGKKEEEKKSKAINKEYAKEIKMWQNKNKLEKKELKKEWGNIRESKIAGNQKQKIG